MRKYGSSLITFNKLRKFQQFLDNFRQVWTSFDMFWQVWKSFESFRKFQTSLDRFREVSTSLDQLQTSFNRFRQVFKKAYLILCRWAYSSSSDKIKFTSLTRMDKCADLVKNLSKFWHVLTHFDISWQVLTSFDKFEEDFRQVASSKFTSLTWLNIFLVH